MRAGVTTVVIPKLNEKDLVDVPEEAKQKLKFIPVETVDEVLNVALEKGGNHQLTQIDTNDRLPS
jgi:ATP-dependent Lon protease